MSPPEARWGVIGGSGFYEFLDDVTTIEIDTPYGRPAGPVDIGTIAGHPVAFLARHGRNHDFAAHRVPYRANVWAMHAVGVRSLIAPCSVGSLQPDIHPGQLVVIDQLVDRTWGRLDTFHDAGGPPDLTGAAATLHHQTFAEPYDDEIRALLVASGRRTGAEVIDGGTMVVINGPRFSTRAESRWFRQMGWHVVNMTGYPESVLAAELGVRYGAVALVTDMDAGVESGEGVGQEEVFAAFARNTERLKALLVRAIETLPDPAGCACATWAEGIDLTYELP